MTRSADRPGRSASTVTKQWAALLSLNLALLRNMHNAIDGLRLVRLRLLWHSSSMFLSLAFAVLTPAVPRERSLLDALVGKAPVLTPEQRQRAARRTAANAACHRRYMGQDYWPQPAIWKVADADTSIFLFGTIHVLPYDFDWRTTQLDKIVKEAGSLIVEGGAVPTGQPVMPSGLPPVVDRLEGEARTLWRGMLAMLPEENGAAFDALPTWQVARQIDATARRRRAPPLDAGADNQLMVTFKNSGKRVEAIEDSAAVDGTLSSVPEVEQRRVLTAQLQDVARPRSIPSGWPCSIAGRVVKASTRTTRGLGRAERLVIVCWIGATRPGLIRSLDA
jgi:hypothetical protein